MYSSRASLIQPFAMSKYFRPWNIDQTLLLPPSVQDFVPKDHVSRFIVGLVRESLDLKEITGSYVSGLGQPPFDPRMDWWRFCCTAMRVDCIRRGALPEPAASGTIL